MTKEIHWLEYCKSCGRNHRMKMRGCPTCNVYETPQPASDKVADTCLAHYECDGCEAYKEHTNPY